MALKKVKKQTVGDIVFEQLQDQIISGFWKPGEKLPSENALAEELEVSRLTVRNALQRLRSMGFIQASQGDGTYVRDISNRNVFEALEPVLAISRPDLSYLLEYRAIVEPACAALAAERIGPEGIVQLKELCRDYQDAVKKNDIEKALSADLLLHYSIVEATDNPVMMRIFDVTRNVYRKNMYEIISESGLSDLGTRWHAKIVEAIAEHDAAKAGEFMRQHISETLERVRLLKKE